MLLGYLGVSREALPGQADPVPRVSGGIGGVFLAVLGAYFLGTQEMRNDSGRLDRLEQMVEELHDGAADAAPTRRSCRNGRAQRPTAGRRRAPPRKVVAVPGGELFHRADCAMAEGKDGDRADARRGTQARHAPVPDLRAVASLA